MVRGWLGVPSLLCWPATAAAAALVADGDVASLIQTRGPPTIHIPRFRQDYGQDLRLAGAEVRYLEEHALPKHNTKLLAITIVGRGRLGNRLFQWAALLSIAKEAGYPIVIKEHGHYTPSYIPQMTKLSSLIWNTDEFEWLSNQPAKCHIWDRPPIIVDSGHEKLGQAMNWMGKVGHDHTHAKNETKPEPGEDWSEPFARAILDTATPDPCRIIELDGFYQQQWYFMKHIDWLRKIFWNTILETRARQTLKEMFPAASEHEPPRVAIHFRLTDYVGTTRTLPMNFYHDALKKMKDLTKSDMLTCVMFSDDIDLAMTMSEELSECTRRVPVSRQVDDKVSFYMLGIMPNIILADSTYSFWAARLSPYNPTVVSPFVHHEKSKQIHADTLYLTQTPGWTVIDTTTGRMERDMSWHDVGFNEQEGPISEWAA